MASTPTTATAARPLDKIPLDLWRQAAILVLGGFLSRLTTSIVNIGLTPMGDGFGVSLETMQWVATGYLLALAAAVPVSSWAARRIGPTRLWLIALALFTLVSALCALSATAGQLIAARVLLGLCGGLLVPVGQMLLGMAAGPKRMGRIMGTMGLVVVLAPAIGSTVGSALLAWRDWTWLFWINVPLGLAALLAGWRWLPRAEAGVAGRLDGPGLVLLTIGLPLMTWGVSGIARAGGFGSAAANGAVLFGLAFIAAFIVRALRIDAPLIHIRLLAGRIFGPAGLVMFCAGFTVFGGQVVLPLYYLLVRHETVFMTGLLILPQDLGIALAMPLAGRLADRFGGGRLVVAGIGLTVLGTVPLSLLAPDTSYLWLSVVLAVRGFGMVLAGMPAMMVALASLPREAMPDAVPLLNILDRTGASIGTALAVALFGLFLPAGGADAAGALAAFDATHGWLALVAAVPLLPALLLLRAERRRPAGAAA